MDIEYADGYSSIADIADAVINNCAEAQGCEPGKVEVVPITAIDEVEMDRALENPAELSEHEWDTLRDQISAEVMSRGPHVD
jgi:hypothetical protein